MASRIIKSKKKVKRISYKSLHKKAWKLMSRYVRLKYSDNGFIKCYTCGVVREIKDIDCGHYFHNKLDFDERNLRPQCTRCNRYLHGNLAIYGAKLSQELGKAGMKKLLLDANTKIYKYEDLEKIIKSL